MTTEPIRTPAVAGQFYEADADALTRQIEQCYTGSRGPGSLPEVNEDGPREIIGMMCPHAGYAFSGEPAAYCYHALAADGVPEVAVIIGPAHRRPQPGIQTSGVWRTPLGDIPIAADVAADIHAHLPVFEDDPRQFAGEHSLEVQVPFLQHLYGDRVPIVPIMMFRHMEPPARKIADAVIAGTEGRDAVVIASSDMTHFQPSETAHEQDMLLIDEITDLDPEGLLEQRAAGDISMCGAGPTAAMLYAAKGRGASEAELLTYGHSGEVHPSASVVGYASVVVR